MAMKSSSAVISFITRYITAPAHVSHAFVTDAELLHAFQSRAYPLASILQALHAYLTVGDVLDSTILVDMNVDTVGLKVHRLHAIRLENAVLLGKIALRESLQSHALATIFTSRYRRRTYDFIVLVAELLAHELAHPVVLRVAVLGLQTGDYERHVVCVWL